MSITATSDLKCNVCGSTHNVCLCITCQKPICPNHRAGFGEAGMYFCNPGACLPGMAFGAQTKAVDHRALMISYAKKTAWATAVAVGIFLLYYFHG